MEEMIRYLAETQRLMAENITKLTEVQQTQQQQLQTQQQELAAMQNAVVTHDAEIAEYRQKQSETDQRFNVLLEEVRYLIRKFVSGGSNGSD